MRKNRSNFLRNKNYKPLDVFGMVFTAAPLQASVYILLTFVQAVFPAIALPLATANFVDTVTAVFEKTKPQGEVYIALAVLLSVLGVMVITGTVAELFISRVRIKLELVLTPEMADTHAALSYKHIENAESLELIQRVTSGPVNSLTDGFTSYLDAARVIASSVSLMGLIITQAWWAAVLICVFSVPMFWLSLRAGKKNYSAKRDAEKYNRRTWYLDSVMTSREYAEERTLFGYADNLVNSYQDQYEKGRRTQMGVQFKTLLTRNGSGFILAAVGLFAALALLRSVTANQISAGMYIGIVGAVFSMIEELSWRSAVSVEGISRFAEYLKDLSSFAALSGGAEILSKPDENAPKFETLELKNVRFKYPGADEYVLDGLSFKISGGRHSAFVGVNGAGKTTVTKLLTGLYTEYEGEILINGKELNEYKPGEVKAMFSVVYQDFARYQISLEDNIALGDISGQKTDERILEAARKAGLDEIIGELKLGIKTPLGKIKENGQDLSGGQWQKIAFARSLLSRAPVKILDEPTAAIV
ncbi:MAG: ABC transporter ATP-binding protein/permease [Clostridiales bacterium]|jgi:ATP-binding cassette subfamily B protein|nr:ABC transporter ATP-binding protein/permease [Clostridiales bacterium]